MSRRVLSTIGLVALATVACSSPTDVDVDALVDQIPAAVSPDAPESVTDVSCGDELPIGEGLTTTCRAQLAGSPISLEVTQLDDNASLAVEVDRTLVDVPELAEVVGQRFTDDLGVQTAVLCAGPPLLVATVGSEIRCVATDPGGVERTVVVTLVDGDGAYRVTLD